MLRSTVLAAAAICWSIVTLPTHASAQGAPTAYRGSEEDRNACTPDVFRLCSKFIPDATQITICLQQRLRFLTPECRAVFTRPSEAHRTVVPDAAVSRLRRDQHELQFE
jgi:hypothetical protein